MLLKIIIILIIIIIYYQINTKKLIYSVYEKEIFQNNYNVRKCIILFGLCRNYKSLVNLENIIKKYNFDTFAYVNFIDSNQVRLFEGKCNKLVNPSIFLQKNCKQYYLENQKNYEKYIHQLYIKCLQYGLDSAWKKRGNISIKYLLFQLHSLNMCYQLFPLHKYQLIYCLRIDQLYQDLPIIKYQPNTFYVFNRKIKDEIFDRNYIISVDIAKYILTRIQKVINYCQVKKQPIQSEKFLKWIIDINNINIKFVNFEGIRLKECLIIHLNTIIVNKSKKLINYIFFLTDFQIFLSILNYENSYHLDFKILKKKIS